MARAKQVKPVRVRKVTLPKAKSISVGIKTHVPKGKKYKWK